jgi:1-phosphofructokinase family hexose kinase
LESLGLQTDFVTIQGETRTNVSVVSLAEGRYLKVNEAGPPISPSELEALRAKVRSLTATGDWWVLAGSLPPGVPPEIYAELVELVQAGGGRAIVDTSGPALRAVLAARPYLIKPNAAEASELTGLPITSPAEALQAAQALQAQGLERILISLGAEGAVLQVGDEQWVATPPPISEANPIGAGDSTVGGLVYALNRSLGWAEVLRWSMACGAATASLPGTALGELAMVEALLGKVGLGWK